MLPGGDGQGAKILGTREFARYYRQKQRPVDARQSVTVNTVLAKWVLFCDEQRQDARCCVVTFLGKALNSALCCCMPPAVLCITSVAQAGF